MKHAGGRPQKTIADLPDNWEEDILEFASEGGGVVGCIKILKISRDLWYAFIERDPEFKEVVRDCRLQSQAWWEEKMLAAAVGSDSGAANATLMIYNMKNRFADDWQDRKVIEQTVIEIKKTDSELDKEISDLQDKIVNPNGR